MAYYYYYQQHHMASSGSMSPETTSAELSPPVLLLSPQQQQQQQQQKLNLPLLSSILPSGTTSKPITTDMTSEQNQQLPTPNTFIRHCDDIGLFHDLQNIVVMSSLTGSSGDTSTTTVPITTNVSMNTTSASTEQPTTANVFDSSSTAILSTMMMANPFDETFKQAVLQQQKSDTNSSEIIFHNNNSNNDGDLNTPFIATTTAVDTSNNINKNNPLTMTTSVDMITAVVTTPLEVESLTTASTIIPESHQQNLFISTSAAEATAGTVLVMLVEQQELSPIQSQYHLESFVVPTTTTTTTNVIDTTTMTSDLQDYYGNEDGDENSDIVINVESETTDIKQALKQNLLGKRLFQGKQKPPSVSIKYPEHGQRQQQNNDIDLAINVANHDNMAHENSHENDEERIEKHKRDLLERNRRAAKRSRIKRKQVWERISEENRKLKIENVRLREAISKFVSHGCGGLQQ